MTNYMTKNLKRANIEKIVEFILHEVDSGDECETSRSLEERCQVAELKQHKFLKELIPDEKSAEYSEMMHVTSDILDYYFALGLKAGVNIFIDLFR